MCICTLLHKYRYNKVRKEKLLTNLRVFDNNKQYISCALFFHFLYLITYLLLLWVLLLTADNSWDLSIYDN